VQETPAGGRRRAAIIAGVAAVVVLAAGGFFALKAYQNKDGGGTPTTSPSTIGKWQELPKIPGNSTIEGAGAAVVNGNLYVIGGYTGEEPRSQTDEVNIYDIDRGSWRDGPKLPRPLSHMSVVLDGAKSIWVIGGWAVDGATDQVWQLKLGSNKWEEGPNLPGKRISGAAVEDSDGIVFAGGTGSDQEPKADIWALKDTGWTSLGQLSVARDKLTATTDRASRIWFIGGRRQADKDTKVAVDTIDILTNRKMDTSEQLKLDHPREGAAAMSISGIGLCVLGGNNGATVYDWWCQDGAQTAKLPKQQLPRAGMAVALADSVIYAAGGYNDSKNLHGTATLEAFQYGK
jgi:N-acetylneuraminic acid mutarotase